jgi:LemA protein
VNTQAIFEHFYRMPRLARPKRSLTRWLVRKFWNWVQLNNTGLVLASLGIAIWITSHIYYYNKLIDLEWNVGAARAQIVALQEKRDHILRNLTKLVSYYANYERGLMKEIITLRTDKKPSEPVSVQQLLTQLDAVAEQYPSLDLTKSVQQLSEAVNTTESEIATRIVEYNTAVNVYTTALSQFPANVFGRLLGFRDKDFYAPQNRAVLDYRVVEP